MKLLNTYQHTWNSSVQSRRDEDYFADIGADK